jgi:hypothetical protein
MHRFGRVAYLHATRRRNKIALVLGAVALPLAFGERKPSRCDTQCIDEDAIDVKDPRLQ